MTVGTDLARKAPTVTDRRYKFPYFPASVTKAP